MERKLFSLLVAGIVFSAVLGWNQSPQAALCGKCRDLMFVDSPGKCIDCGGPTASGALQLCPKCSAKRHQCEHCLAATTEQDEGAAQGKPAAPPPETPHSNASAQDRPPLGWTAPANPGHPAGPDNAASLPMGPEINPPPAAKAEMPAPRDSLPESKPPAELPADPVTPAKLRPLDPTKAGLYTSGKWRYQLQITSPGARNEGRWGWLSYDGRKLPRGNVNDYYNTPWGPIFWVDVPTTAWGVHGWMPVPLTQIPRQGQALTPPRRGVGRQSQPTARTASPTNPRVQTLQINKSHNGQLARLRVGNVLVIRLPGNSTAGYQWRTATTNSTSVRLTVRPQYSPPASPRDGVGHVYVHLPGRAAGKRFDPPLLRPPRRSPAAARFFCHRCQRGACRCGRPARRQQPPGGGMNAGFLLAERVCDNGRFRRVIERRPSGRTKLCGRERHACWPTPIISPARLPRR